jgi:hypothetical protein
MVGSVDGPAVPEGADLLAGDQEGTGRWLVVRTWVVEADTASEARAAAASERGWLLTETVTGLATEPPAAMPVSRPSRPARSTDFCPRLFTIVRSPRSGRPRAGRAMRVPADHRRRWFRGHRERVRRRASLCHLRLSAVRLHRLEGHQRRRPLLWGHPMTSWPAPARWQGCAFSSGGSGRTRTLMMLLPDRSGSSTAC